MSTARYQLLEDEEQTKIIDKLTKSSNENKSTNTSTFTTSFFSEKHVQQVKKAWEGVEQQCVNLKKILDNIFWNKNDKNPSSISVNNLMKMFQAAKDSIDKTSKVIEFATILTAAHPLHKDQVVINTQTLYQNQFGNMQHSFNLKIADVIKYLINSGKDLASNQFSQKFQVEKNVIKPQR